jgi:hypothetical protein
MDPPAVRRIRRRSDDQRAPIEPRTSPPSLAQMVGTSSTSSAKQASRCPPDQRASSPIQTRRLLTMRERPPARRRISLLQRTTHEHVVEPGADDRKGRESRREPASGSDASCSIAGCRNTPPPHQRPYPKGTPDRSRPRFQVRDADTEPLAGPHRRKAAARAQRSVSRSRRRGRAAGSPR